MNIYESFAKRFDFLIKGDYDTFFERIPATDVYIWCKAVQSEYEYFSGHKSFVSFVKGVFVGGTVFALIVWLQG